MKAKLNYKGFIKEVEVKKEEVGGAKIPPPIIKIRVGRELWTFYRGNKEYFITEAKKIFNQHLLDDF